MSLLLCVSQGTNKMSTKAVLSSEIQLRQGVLPSLLRLLTEFCCLWTEGFDFLLAVGQRSRSTRSCHLLFLSCQVPQDGLLHPQSPQQKARVQMKGGYWIHQILLAGRRLIKLCSCNPVLPFKENEGCLRGKKWELRGRSHKSHKGIIPRPCNLIKKLNN